jgi:hypothetical protein
MAGEGQSKGGRKSDDAFTHFEKLEGTRNTITKRWDCVCKYCRTKFLSLKVELVRSHLLACNSAPQAVVADIESAGIASVPVPSYAAQMSTTLGAGGSSNVPSKQGRAPLNHGTMLSHFTTKVTPDQQKV